MKKQKEKILEYVRNNVNRIIGAMMLSIIISILFAEQISNLVYSHAKYEDIIIQAYPIETECTGKAKIIDNNYAKSDTSNIMTVKKYGFFSFEKLLDSVDEIKDMKIVMPKDSESGYGYFYPATEDAFMRLKMPVFPNTCITVVIDNNEFGLVVRYEKGGFERYIGEYENQLEMVECLKIYPFETEDYIYIFIYYAVAYFLCIVVWFFIVMILLHILDQILLTNNFFNTYSSKWMFLIIFLLFFVYSSVLYIAHKEVFQVGELSDAYYYMNPVVLDENGKFSWDVFAHNLYAFRGYLSVVIAIAFNFIASILSMDVMFCYFAYFALVTAFALGIMIPKMYRSMMKQDCTNLMVLMMYGCFFLFWRKFFFFALTDIPAAMFALCAISFMAVELKEKRNRNIFSIGVFIGLAASYRAAYTYVFYGICIVLIANMAICIRRRELVIKKGISLFAFLLVGLLLVTWPQAVINIIREHIGVFPYSAGWVNDICSGKVINDTWCDFTNGLHTYGFLTPQNSDRQFALIDQYYYMDKYYNVGDALFMLLANPVQFGCGYLKRMFWALSIGAESVYGALPNSQVVLTGTILCNYLIFGTFLYMWCKNKSGSIVPKKTGLMYILLMMLTIIIQNLTHIEKRYNLFFLLMVYFFVVYIGLHCYQRIREKGEHISIRYIVTMTIFVISCFAVRQMIEINFIYK